MAAINYEVDGGITGAGTLNAGTGAATVTFGGTSTISLANAGFKNIVVNGILNGSSGQSISVDGDFTLNTGSAFNGNGGTVVFSAQPTGHTISGVVVGEFSNINVNNGAANPDLTFASNQDLLGILTLSPGAIASSGGFLTLRSTNDNLAVDASIASLSSGADVTGNVNIQRYISAEAPAGIYRYLSSPLIGGTIAQWQTKFSVTGNFTGHSTTDPSTGTNVVCGVTMLPTKNSLFYWSENLQKYVGYPTDADGGVNAPLVPGRGYETFIRNCSTPTIPVLTGSIYNADKSGDFDFGSLMTNTGTGGFAGYNLVGNPFPSAIDWAASSGWTRPGISPVAAISDNGSGNLVFRYIDYTTAPPGGAAVIASGQGFWVRTSAQAPSTFSLKASEGVKAAAGSSYQFYRVANPVIDNLEISIANGAIQDKAIYKLNSNSVASLDDFDGPKLDNALLNLSTLSSENYKMAINSTNALPLNAPIQIYISTPGADPQTSEPYKIMPDGNYTLSFGMNGLFNTYSLFLQDSFTGKSQKLEQGVRYTFTASREKPGSVAANRFAITLSEKEALIGNADANGDSFNGIFPNPTNGVVTIRAKLDTESTAKILDNVGRTIGAINLNKATDGYYEGDYDFSGHSSGIYFVQVANSSVVFKVIRK